MHSTADWINPAATRDSVIAICRNVLTFRAEFLANTHTRAYLVRHVQWLESERKVVSNRQQTWSSSFNPTTA